MLKEFSDAFLDHFFPRELRKANDEDFKNLKQGMISVKECTLKFTQLFCYATKLVSNMKSYMRKFVSDLFYDLVLDVRGDIE